MIIAALKMLHDMLKFVFVEMSFNKLSLERDNSFGSEEVDENGIFSFFNEDLWEF
jgi:hypothetical protein